jgi:hypothetical protein
MFAEVAAKYDIYDKSPSPSFVGLFGGISRPAAQLAEREGLAPLRYGAWPQS